MAAVAVLVAATAAAAPGRSHASPGGRIAFVRTGEYGRDVGELFVMNADGSRQRGLTRSPADDSQPVWSPDGRTIAFVRQEHVPGSHGRSWMTNVYVLDPDAGHPRRLTYTAWSDGPVWSPDGRRIAYIRHFETPPGNPTGETTPEIYVMNADGSGKQRLTRNRLWERSLTWSPDGRLTFVRGPNRDSQTRSEIWVMNPDGSGAHPLTRNRIEEENVRWSPDGMRLAFTRWRDAETFSIFVMNADGSGSRRLLPWRNDGETDWQIPVWSPDGRKIAYLSGNFDLHVMNADGSDRRRLAKNASLPSWSPDGQTLAFARDPAIWTADADRGRPRRLVPAPGRPAFSLRENWAPVWSPG